MRKGLLCAVAVTGLVASICFPHLPVLSVFAENEVEKPSIIIYELGDPRVPTMDESNAVIHDLNISEDNKADVQSLDNAHQKQTIIYELGDDRIPTIDWDTVNDLHILKETVARGDNEPKTYYNLWAGAYYYRFSNAQKSVYTETYFSTDANGYISISTSGIDNPVRISMVEYETDQVASTWAGDPGSVSGISFPGDVSKLYYFKFEPYGVTSISGSGRIFLDD